MIICGCIVDFIFRYSWPYQTAAMFREYLYQIKEKQKKAENTHYTFNTSATQAILRLAFATISFAHHWSDHADTAPRQPGRRGVLLPA